MTQSGVELTGVSKRFEPSGKVALDRIDLKVDEGSFTAIVGASGSGKTTLLRVVGGLEEPTDGSVHFRGAPPAQHRNLKNIGWMAQKAALLPWLTAVENVRLAQKMNPRPNRPEPEPEGLLEMVGLAAELDSYPFEMSGGMQQRVALARTLAVGAPLWLMDEPFAALDELTREALADDLIEIWKGLETTVLWVTHHIPEAIKLADRVILLGPDTGTLIGDITIDLLRPREQTSTEFQSLVRRARGILRGDAAQSDLLGAVG